MSCARFVEDYAHILETAFLRDLLHGLLCVPDAEKQAACLQLDGCRTGMQVLAVELPLSEGKEKEFVQPACERHFLSDMEKAFADFTFFRPVKTAHNIYAVIVSTDRQPPLGAFTGVVSPEKKSVYNFRCAAGSPVPSLFDIDSSYREARQLLRLCSCVDIDCRILTCDDLHSALPVKGVYYPLSLEQSLIQAVIHKKIELWQSILTDIIIENRTENGQHTAHLASLFIATIYRIFDSVQKYPADVFPEPVRVFWDILLCRTTERLYECVKHIFFTLSDALQSGQKQKNIFLVKRMREYVRENYTKDISLYDLAKSVNLSPNYVSAVFKDGFAENFKSYLNRCRYEAACKLIRESPGKKLKQVALECGCNTDILTRIFFKCGGILPSDFQKSVLREKLTL